MNYTKLCQDNCEQSDIMITREISRTPFKDLWDDDVIMLTSRLTVCILH